MKKYNKSLSNIKYCSFRMTFIYSIHHYLEIKSWLSINSNFFFQVDGFTEEEFKKILSSVLTKRFSYHPSVVKLVEEEYDPVEFANSSDDMNRLSKYVDVSIVKKNNLLIKLINFIINVYIIFLIKMIFNVNWHETNIHVVDYCYA